MSYFQVEIEKPNGDIIFGWLPAVPRRGDHFCTMNIEAPSSDYFVGHVEWYPTNDFRDESVAVLIKLTLVTPPDLLQSASK